VLRQGARGLLDMLMSSLKNTIAALERGQGHDPPLPTFTAPLVTCVTPSSKVSGVAII